MEFETTIPTGHIDIAKLESLVTTLSQALGANATIGTTYVIKTDNGELADIFDNFAVNLEQRQPKKLEGKVMKRAKRGTHAPKKAKPEDGFGPNSYKNIATDEIISARALNEKLKDGEVDDNVVFVKPDGRRFVTLGGKLIQEP